MYANLQGIFISQSLLKSYEFDMDEKVILIYASQCNGLTISREQFKNDLGYKTLSKPHKCLDSLKVKTSGLFDYELDNKNITFTVNFSILNNSADELVEKSKEISKTISKSKTDFKDKDDIEQVFDYFIGKLKENKEDTNISLTKNRQKLIHNFLLHYSVDDARHIIDFKFKQWGNPNSPMHEFFRIETLFRPNNSLKYLEGYYHKQQNNDKRQKQTRHHKETNELARKGIFG